MNREDVIRMAREAGFYVNEKARQHQPNCISHTYHMIDEQLERFAALIASRVAAAERNRTWTQDHWTEYERSIAAAAKAEEREACAAICDRFQARDVGMQPAECAGAIRARGQA